MPLDGEVKALLEAANRAHEKLHAWLRWLVLLAAGFFSLMAGQLAGKPLSAWMGWALKAALATNALGILAGSIALYAEADVARRLVEAQKARVSTLLDGAPPSSIAPAVANRPKWAQRAERACYALLTASLLSWLAFVLLL
jgi:hypothetical protein